MKSTPLVSVIVPIYNTKESYLMQCLNSIEKQNYTNTEVILVNDGSNEDVKQCITNYLLKIKHSTQKWKVIHQQNKGLSAARNAGYDVAKGEYIQFLDADDYFDPHFLSNAVRRAKLTSAEVVIENFNIKDYGSGVLSDGVNIRKFPKKDSFKLTDFPESKLQTIPYNVWSKLFKKSFLDRYNIRHDEGLYRAEDILFSYSALINAKKITLLPEPYITYRNNMPGSNSQTNDSFPSMPVVSWRKLHHYLVINKVYDVYKDDFEVAMLDSIYWHLVRLNTDQGKGELGRKAQEFIDSIDNKKINNHALVIAVASVNPLLLTLLDEQSSTVFSLQAEVEKLNTDLNHITNPGVKNSTHQLIRAIKRRLII